MRLIRSNLRQSLRNIWFKKEAIIIENIVFIDFRVSLEDLVDIALEINPKSINLHKNNKDKGKATVRQVLAYIGGKMGYTDEAIASRIGSSRSTVTLARKRVEEALLYNEVPMRKLYNTFLEKLRKHPNSEVLDYVINI